MEKKGAQIDQILVTINPKPWSQWSGRKKRRKKGG
jgi:hypothetical protein